MKEKRKSYRERYFEDYKAVKVAANNKKGYKLEYHYIGRWMGWTSERYSMKQVKLAFAGMELVSIAIYVAAILSHSPFTVSRLANGFGTISLIPWMLELYGVVRFAAAGNHVKELTGEEIDRAIRAGTVLRALLVAASVIAGLADILLHKTAAVQDIPVVLTVLVSGGLSLLIRRFYSGLEVLSYRNDNGRPGSRI